MGLGSGPSGPKMGSLDEAIYAGVQEALGYDE
jgi:hypothetical protein